MEFLPALDAQEKPKEGIWYSLIPGGRSPGVSVGHTCTYSPCRNGGKGRVLIVGGANPGGSFSHTHVINMDSLKWDILEWKGLSPRYEHCAFVPQRHPRNLWVFGGAEQTGNRNCMQKIQLSDSKAHWENITVNGKPPSPRTYHTNSACLGNALYVFCGGEAGTSPVSDQKLHVFDTVSSTWTQPKTQGTQPPARHGHIIVASGSKIYVHGGMAKGELYDDMYSLDTKSMTWEMVHPEGDVPPGVAAHSGMALGNNIYIFGGMTGDGAINDMYRFNIEKNSWTLMKFEGDLPSNRLDHCMCLLPWKVDAGGSEEQAANAPATAITRATTAKTPASAIAKIPVVATATAKASVPVPATAKAPVPVPATAKTSTASAKAPVPPPATANTQASAASATAKAPGPPPATAKTPASAASATAKAPVPPPATAKTPASAALATAKAPVPPPATAKAKTPVLDPATAKAPTRPVTIRTPVPSPGTANAPTRTAAKAPPDTFNLAFVFGGMDTHGVLHNDCVVTVVT